MRRLLVLALLSACDPARPPAATPPAPPDATTAAPGEAEFAARLITAMKATGATGDYRYDPASHIITVPGKSGNLISTVNFYAEYLAVPAGQRADFLARTAREVTRTPDDLSPGSFDAARPHLLPVVRDGLYFESWRMKALDAGAKAIPPTRPLAAALAVGVVVDAADDMRYLTRQNLDEWHHGLDELETIALANLRAGSPEPFTQVAPGLYASRFHDNCDASRVLLVDEIAALHLRGGAVALLPNRDNLFLAGADDAKALLAMADRAEQALKEPRPIDAIPLCLRDRAWRECTPAPDDEVRRRYHDLAMQSWIDLYDDQRNMLQDLVGDDLFVARCLGLRDPKLNESASYAVWSRGVPTLLPRAEYVAFNADPLSADPRSSLGFARWDKVQEVLGKRLTRQEYSPERWATGDYFPTEAELKKLGLKARIP